MRRHTHLRVSSHYYCTHINGPVAQTYDAQNDKYDISQTITDGILSPDCPLIDLHLNRLYALKIQDIATCVISIAEAKALRNSTLQ